MNKKKGKYSELFKNTGILAIGNFSSKILVFLLIPLYTSILSTSEYGFYDLVYTTIQLLVPILTVDITDSVLRFTMDKDCDKRQLVRIDLKYLAIGIICFIVPLILIGAFNFNHYVTEYNLYIALYYVSYMINQYMNQFAKGIDKVKEIAIAGVLSTLITVGLCALLLIIFPLELYGFFISYIAGQAVSAIYLLFATRFKTFFSKKKINKALEKAVIRYSAPLILNNIGWWMNNTSDKYVISYMSGVDANGLLSVAYKIPNILDTFIQIFTQAWQISAIKEYEKDKDNKFYNQIFKYMNCTLLYAALVLILITKWLAHFIFQGDFFGAWNYVPFLVLSCVFTASSAYMAAILSATYQTKPIATSTVVGGVLNVALNFLLIIMLGNNGVTVATAISSFVIFYIRYFYIREYFDKKVIAKVLIQWLFILAQCVLAIFELRILEVILLIVTIVIFWKDLSSMIKNSKKIIN